VRLGAATHQADRHTGRPTLAVLEVVDVAEGERSALAGVIEVTEIGLAIEEEDGGHAFRPEDRQRAHVDIGGDEDAKERR